MGKASTTKKVQRAARAGGKVTGQRKNIGFPVAIAAILLLGIGLVAFARSSNASGGDPELGAHWHSAYGVYLCDRWVTNLSDQGADSLGVHTHDDGIIHIHPFLSGATGEKATLGKFFDQVGLTVSDSSITLPDDETFEGRKYVNGETSCGGEEARVVSAYWDDAKTAAGSEPDGTRTSGFSGEHFDRDGSAYTIAFVPEGTEIPAPIPAANIEELGAADAQPGGQIQGVPENNDLPEGVAGDSDSSEPSSEPTEVAPPTEGPASTDAPATTEAPASSEAPATTEAPAGG